ncbi:hypothetical protein LSM04_000318 [Trypanosoma melophagium]|uniref:uncharacterized protein n=1 Tax=Trypanosoma melophagium TaxID=715481 RepID=UPI00351A27DC|nr:hypothetical protein LSM04_000318 [Trypanosoma melophagium]
MDYIISVYTYVREQINRTGFPLGINGTVDTLDKFLFSDIPSTATYAEALNMWRGLFQALQSFRLDFDVFDESEETIVAMEDALNKFYACLRRNCQEAGNREEDLR